MKKNISFLDTEYGYIENVNDLKLNISIEKEFNEVKEFIQGKNLNLKCDFINYADFIKNMELKEIKNALKKKSLAAPGMEQKLLYSFLLLTVQTSF